MKKISLYTLLILSFCILNACGESDDGTQDIKKAAQAQKDNDLELAEKLYQQALQKALKTKGEESQAYVSVCNELAALYYGQNKQKKAEEYYLKAIKVIEKLPDEALKLATCQDNLGMLYGLQGKYEKAKLYFEQSRPVFKKMAGEKSSSYAYSCSNLGDALCNLGDLEDGMKMLLEAEKIFSSLSKLNDAEKKIFASNHDLLAYFYVQEQNYKQAHDHYIKATKLYDAVFGFNNLNTALVYSNLGLMYDEKLSDYPKALTYYQFANQTFEKSKKQDSINHAINIDNLSYLYSKQKEFDKALEAENIAIQMVEEPKGENPFFYASFVENKAMLLGEMNRLDEAIKTMHESNKIFETLYKSAPDNPKYVDSYAFNLRDMAHLYEKKGDRPKVKTYLLQAKELFAKLYGEESKAYQDVTQQLNHF